MRMRWCSVSIPLGKRNPTQTDLRVKVSGQKIVTQPAPYTISGCSHAPAVRWKRALRYGHLDQRRNPGQGEWSAGIAQR